MSLTRLKIWRLETGVMDISADMVPEFAEALGVTVASLYRKPRKSAA